MPGWAEIKPTMVPDWVAKDPQSSPVWEITGAEVRSCSTIHEVYNYQFHTAHGISIRIPRVTRVGGHCGIVYRTYNSRLR